MKIREAEKVARDDWSAQRKRALTKFVLVFALKSPNYGFYIPELMQNLTFEIVF